MMNAQDLLNIEVEMKKAERLVNQLTGPLTACPKLVKNFVVKIGFGVVEGLKLIEGSTDHESLLACYKIEVAVYKAMLEVLSEQAGKT